MKHLYEYEDEEIKTMMTDLEGVGHGSLKGWLISLVLNGYHSAADGTCYLCIGAEDIKEAMSLYVTFLADVYGFSQENIENSLSKKDFSFHLVGYELFKSDSDFEADESPNILGIWEGLTPIPKSAFVEEIITNNPIFSLDEIKKKFSNAESVLRANKKGNYDE